MVTTGDRAAPGRRASPEGVVGGFGASTRAADEALALMPDAATVLLVEGITDRIALETLAAADGRDLAGEGVLVAPIGGAHAVRRVLTALASAAASGVARPRLGGLCDRREENVFRRALTEAGPAAPRTRAELAELGFFVCVDDLEEELIRAVGVPGVLEVFESAGDLRSFRVFQRQPAWRGRPVDAQLYRFVRSVSERNLLYAGLLAEAAARQGSAPEPLAGLLEHAR
ncbi:TOPRIM nucleotidyl transferase/hydrolase domain-containing protein [Myceligenerans pegani]|uniref:ATP-dependent endonuclease n=1 Tax=Myceligenerans pegani TaxID=2776917 RepID=A0ABR9MUX8_9MICO|nr:TOPRIM nucleotidyl transferase/hydrolase domain-containing protein [Myceligenerans sp. TRM 65318]MBE1874930.1 ATP-dependent endonuclease [Myceligenerans sp. TRM 65318]MBE3017201.1 ATP-dependent endonuclease [Myceligenerans sp. TRM 65318]